MGRLTRALGLVALVAAGALVTVVSPLAAAPPLKFGPIVYVDQSLAGGEPFVIQSLQHGTLLYSSHEGTTHIYRPGLPGYAAGIFAANYRNQVNNWVSTDGGKTWKFVSVLGSGFAPIPVQNSGFSDPDLTADEGGRLYNTGINLANTSLFSSGDGGKSFDRGNLQCASGDRPWLAGGAADNVFMSDNLNIGGHQVVHSGDGGTTCDAKVPFSGGLAGGGVQADGTLNNIPWSGVGKLYYDHKDGSLVEPAIFQNPGTTVGLGFDYLAHAQAAFPADGTKSFTPKVVVPSTTLFSHWPAMTIDSDQNVYLVWDTDDRASDTGGCNSTGSATANKVLMVTGKHVGPQQWTWSAPITVAAPAKGRVLWPWVAVGAPGNVSVVWYQYDKVVDPDCATDGNVFIYDSHILGLFSGAPTTTVTNASDRPISSKGICQGGTGCVASGKDRRLGDFFTNAIDDKGCVMIVSGDTTLPDPVTGGDQPISHPIFIRQLTGPSLTGGNCAGTSAGATTPASLATTGAGSGGTPNTAGQSPGTWGVLLGLLALAGALTALGWRLRRAV